MTKIAIPFPARSEVHWWVSAVASMRALASAVWAACDVEPRWMVRR